MPDYEKLAEASENYDDEFDDVFIDGKWMQHLRLQHVSLNAKICFPKRFFSDRRPNIEKRRTAGQN